jgi:hypothetical protein
MSCAYPSFSSFEHDFQKDFVLQPKFSQDLAPGVVASCPGCLILLFGWRLQLLCLHFTIMYFQNRTPKRFHIKKNGQKSSTTGALVVLFYKNMTGCNREINSSAKLKS